jgi:ribosomal protein S12 methylthiotransferase
LQHIDNQVLARMRRQITREETIDLIRIAREKVPNITLRTTMLVGFPGETEAEFETLCHFIEEMRFERVGVFQYSHEEGTSAHQLEDNVPSEVKESRAARLMAIQEDISFEKNEAKIGQTMKVLFDRKEGAYFVGRTEFDSPEVDNEVLVKARKSAVRIGDFAHVKITNVEAFDLYGTIVQEI